MNRLELATILALGLLLASCAHYPENDPLPQQDSSVGYRFQNLTPSRDRDEIFVVLSFSGGGTRAAALSYGVLKKLAEIPVPGEPDLRLLDEVDVISSVSGGSFTAAYYALHGDDIFESFESRFLRQNIQGTLSQGLFQPRNWLRFASPTFDRVDMAAEVYDRDIFDGKSFSALTRRGKRPYVIINATDMSIGNRFEFTQEQFDLISSDLSTFPIARAVAASSAFPVLLSPVRLVNHPRRPGSDRPPWIDNALGDRWVNPTRYQRARVADSYLATPSGSSEKKRRYIHLIDGGISDNIGLRGPLRALTTSESSWSVLNQINEGQIKRLVVIVVDAKTGEPATWDQSEKSPGLKDVLYTVCTTPMENYSNETVQAYEETLRSQKQLADTYAAIKRRVPDITLPEIRAAEFNFVHISFDDLDDEEERKYFLSLPTSFALQDDQVSRLIEVAGKLLDEARPFQEFLSALAGGE